MAVYNYTVTVVASSTYGQNVYSLNGTEKPQLNVVVGDTINFDISDNSVSAHPLGVGPNNGTSNPYDSTDGVTYSVNSITYSTFSTFLSAFSSKTSGQPASISWVIQSSADVDSWYWCAYHSNMGNSISIPDATDYDAPGNTSISLESGAASTYNTTINVTLSATDNIGIDGYYLSESVTTPGTGVFISVPSTVNYTDTVQFTFSVGFGTKTVYAWFKDAGGNISNPVSSSIVLLSLDSTAPYNSSISINSGASSTGTASVSISISAEDDVGVTGYYLSETNQTPDINSFISVASNTNYSDIVSFNLSAVNGTHYVYAWFRDFGENISSVVSDSIELDLSDPNAPLNPSLTINGGASTTSLYQVSCLMTGFDSVGVTGYYLSESSLTPIADNFVPTYSSQSFSQTAIFELIPSNLPVTVETKTVYLWLRDAAGNISNSTSDSIVLDTTQNDPADDIFMPTNSGVTILQGEYVDTRIVTCQISGSDNVGISGYYLSESPNIPSINDFILVGTSPVVSLTRNFIFLLNELAGYKILHLWFLDSSGNISTMSTDVVYLNFANAGEANFLIKDGILATNRPGILQSRTIPSNINELFIGPTQISNSIDIQGTLAVFNEFDIVEGGDVDITGTLDLR